MISDWTSIYMRLIIWVHKNVKTGYIWNDYESGPLSYMIMFRNEPCSLYSFKWTHTIWFVHLLCGLWTVFKRKDIVRLDYSFFFSFSFFCFFFSFFNDFSLVLLRLIKCNILIYQTQKNIRSIYQI